MTTPPSASFTSLSPELLDEIQRLVDAAIDRLLSADSTRLGAAAAAAINEKRRAQGQPDLNL